MDTQLLGNLSNKQLRKVLKYKRFTEWLRFIKFILVLIASIGVITLAAIVRPDALTYVLPLASFPAVGLGIDKILSNRRNIQ